MWVNAKSGNPVPKHLHPVPLIGAHLSEQAVWRQAEHALPHAPAYTASDWCCRMQRITCSG